MLTNPEELIYVNTQEMHSNVKTEGTLKFVFFLVMADQSKCKKRKKSTGGSTTLLHLLGWVRYFCYADFVGGLQQTQARVVIFMSNNGISFEDFWGLFSSPLDRFWSGCSLKQSFFVLTISCHSHKYLSLVYLSIHSPNV